MEEAALRIPNHKIPGEFVNNYPYETNFSALVTKFKKKRKANT